VVVYWRACVYTTDDPLTIWTWYPVGYVVVLRRRTSPVDTLPAVFGAKYIAWYPDVPPDAICENGTFVAIASGAPFASLTVTNTDVAAALCGIDVNVRVQLLWLPGLAMFTPQAVGVDPGPEMSPETMTYSTAASTTVIATIKIVAMTGDTACSSLRMMVFMVLFSLVVVYWRACVYTTDDPLTIWTVYPVGYVVVLRRRTSPVDTLPAVFGAKYIAWYPDVPPDAICENGTFVAIASGAPFASLTVTNTDVAAALCGIDVNVRVQLLWLPGLAMFTPQAVGVDPGPEMSPETMTYSTAASTTVIATIKIVAMTGDTACSSLRMMLLIVLSFLRHLPHSLHGGRGALKRVVVNIRS